MLYIQSTNANDGSMNAARHLRRRHRQRHRQRPRQEPLLAGAAVPAGRREELRRHHRKSLALPADGHLALLARRDLRRPVPRQLRPHQHQRRPLPRDGRRRRPQPRRVRLRDAHLAQARSARPARAHGHRPPHAPSSRRTSSTPRGRSAPSRRRPGSSSPTRSAPRGGSSTPEEFGNVVVRENPDGSVVRLKDVARDRARRAQLSADRPLQRQAGRASSRVFQSPGSNALDVAEGIKKHDGGASRRASRRASTTRSRSTPPRR